MLAAGCRVLVVGASGALGSVLLQLLKKYKDNGLHVVAICSSGNAEKCKEMGADETVGYNPKPFDEQLTSLESKPFQVVFDFVGGKDVERQASAHLEQDGMFVTAVGDQLYMGADGLLTTSEFCG